MAFSEARKVQKDNTEVTDALCEASERTLRNIMDSIEIASDTESDDTRRLYDMTVGRLVRESLEDFYRERLHDKYHDLPVKGCDECNRPSGDVININEDAWRRGQ